MKSALRIFLIVSLLFAVGCVSAPKQTVELAEIVDQQIAEMQASHEKFVRLYYDKLRNDVDHFMETTWIPHFLANVVEGTGESSKRFRSDLDTAYRLATLNWEETIEIKGIESEDVKRVIREAMKKLSAQENATLGIVLLEFAKAAQQQINERRKSLIEPIDEQEGYVLDQLRAGYADIQRGSVAIKGYLASTVKLVEQRDAVLERMGALETQRELLNVAVAASDAAVKALNTARDVEAGMKDFLDEFEKTKDRLRKLADKGGT